MSLLAATQLTAIATMILAAGAIASAIFAVLAFRKQSVEVSILLEQNKRDADYRHREQAVRILVWTDSGKAHVRNTSDQPIRNISFQWLDGSGNRVGPAYAEEPIAPGKEVVFSEVRSGNGILARIDFRDINGVEWTVSSDGKLTEMIYV